MIYIIIWLLLGLFGYVLGRISDLINLGEILITPSDIGYTCLSSAFGIIGFLIGLICFMDALLKGAIGNLIDWFKSDDPFFTIKLKK